MCFQSRGYRGTSRKLLLQQGNQRKMISWLDLRFGCTVAVSACCHSKHPSCQLDFVRSVQPVKLKSLRCTNDLVIREGDTKSVRHQFECLDDRKSF